MLLSPPHLAVITAEGVGGVGLPPTITRLLRHLDTTEEEELLPIVNPDDRGHNNTDSMGPHQGIVGLLREGTIDAFSICAIFNYETPKI